MHSSVVVNIWNAFTTRAQFIPEILLTSVRLHCNQTYAVLLITGLPGPERAGLSSPDVAVVLIDPVDMTDVTRDKGYPSAVEALRGRGDRAALIGEWDEQCDLCDHISVISVTSVTRSGWYRYHTATN